MLHANILIIDDDEIVREMATMILTKGIDKKILAEFGREPGSLELNVIQAEDGVDALSVLQQEKIALILLDVEMPYMDGFQVLEMLKENSALKDIPVVMLTAAADKQTVLRAGTSGVDGYIRKPFMPDDLVRHALKAVLA